MEERALTKEDFQLENYIYPGRFFKSRPRPLRLIESPPSVTTYHDVIYTPTTSWHEPYDGCLYDADLRRIDASCLWKETGDKSMSIEPPYFQGDAGDLATYDRPALYLGYVSSHYGHFLLESLAKWWVLAEQAQAVDRFLIHVPDRSVINIPFVQACLALAAIEQKQLIFFDKPLRIKKVMVPEASFQLRSHIHTAYRKLWAKLLAPADTGQANTSDQPLYVSRGLMTRGVSKYLGEEKIEAYLKSKGVRIINPQNLLFEEQMRLFNKHRRILGIIGSGMHNIVLSKAPKTVVYLTPHLINKNYLLLDSCFDTDSTYLQACRTREPLRRFWLRSLARTKLASKSMPLALARIHELDYERVICWFEESGHL